MGGANVPVELGRTAIPEAKRRVLANMTIDRETKKYRQDTRSNF